MLLYWQQEGFLFCVVVVCLVVVIGKEYCLLGVVWIFYQIGMFGIGDWLWLVVGQIVLGENWIVCIWGVWFLDVVVVQDYLGMLWFGIFFGVGEVVLVFVFVKVWFFDLDWVVGWVYFVVDQYLVWFYWFE